MGAAKVRVVIAAALFLGWIGWLIYLVIDTRHPIVLSRPQFLVANVWMIAELKDKGGIPVVEANVQEIVWCDKDSADLKPGPITIRNLPQVTLAEGWTGPGTYIVPLSPITMPTDTTYRVTPVPPSPGYASPYKSIVIVDVGKNATEIAKTAAEFTGQDVETVEKGLAKRPYRLAKKVAYKEAEKIQGELKAAGAEVVLRDEEDTRIYPVTSETLAQLHGLAPRKE